MPTIRTSAAMGALALAAAACAKDRPAEEAAAAPTAPVVDVPREPAAGEYGGEATASPPARREPPEPQGREQAEISLDGGTWSFSTARDASFSFSFRAHVTVDGDGGTVQFRVDAGP